MDQIAQTENPICSATIDQIRLRRATNWPLASQNFVSSGFQSEIQVGFWSLIKFPFNGRHQRALGRAPNLAVKNSDDWLPGTASMASSLAIQASCQLEGHLKGSQVQLVTCLA